MTDVITQLRTWVRIGAVWVRAQGGAKAVPWRWPAESLFLHHGAAAGTAACCSLLRSSVLSRMAWSTLDSPPKPALDLISITLFPDAGMFFRAILVVVVCTMSIIC